MSRSAVVRIVTAATAGAIVLVGLGGPPSGGALPTGVIEAAPASAAAVAPVAEEARALTAHRIREVRVENVGAQVSARVSHRGGGWPGRTRVRFGVRKQAKARFQVTVHRGGKVRYRRVDGRAWRCGGRHATSPAASNETLVTVPRRCLAGTRAVKAWARTTSAGAVHKRRTAYVQKVRRANVVVFMVDDMRDDDLDGSWLDHTRRWLGDGGVRFVNSFAPLPLCCPARASFFTGQYAHNHEVWTHRPPYGFASFDDTSTLPVWLEQSGYDTMHLGKYLNGYGVQAPPGGGPRERYVPPGWSDWRGSLDSRGTYRYFRTTLNNNGSFDPLKGYQTNAYGRIAKIGVRERAMRSQPYFMNLSFTAPHHGKPHEADDPRQILRDDGVTYPVKTPARPGWVKGRFNDEILASPGVGYENGQIGKPGWLQDMPALNPGEELALRDAARQRAESLHIVDLQVDKVMRQIEKSGDLDSTYVVFTSDNGYFLGEHRIRQGKLYPYEPSLRTPTLVRGPGIPSGQVREDPFTSIDFAPTLLAMTGVDGPSSTFDGRSLLAVAQQGDRGWDRSIVTETTPTGTRPVNGIRTRDFLYAETAGAEPELYDLRVDPNQLDNVVDDPDYAEARADLELALVELRDCAGAECSEPRYDAR